MTASRALIWLRYLPTPGVPIYVRFSRDENERVNESNFAERVQSALSAPVPHLYANGFVVSGTSSDIVTVLELNGSPVATLNLSFTSAKSLVVMLGGQIAQFEEFMQQEIKTSADIEAAAARNGEAQSAPQ